MAMRITTKMMQSRALTNINTNKALQEKLTQQMSTMKKITRPSDDPVIAIRSLKLNASLNKIDQYYEKNTEDAESWLELTESAVKTVSNILTSARKYIVQAANGELTATDRSAIVENLTNYITEIYATGNADSDGRSIFTGYRTNTSLTFQQDKTEKYEITEQWSNTCLGTEVFVRTGDLATINEGNFTTKSTTQYEVESVVVPRIRLSYDNLDFDATAANNADAANVKVGFQVDTKLVNEGGNTGVTVNTTSCSMFVMQDAGPNGELQVLVNGSTTPTLIPNDGSTVDIGNNTELSIVNGQLVINETSNKTGSVYKTTTLDCTQTGNTYTLGSKYETSLTVTSRYSSMTTCNADGSYTYAYDEVLGDDNADNIVYVAETGELLLGTNIQAQLASLSSDATINITYDKTEWEEGDLDPIHYFYTKKYEDNDPDVNHYAAGTKYIEYNAEKLTDPDSDNANQIISYDVGNNQSIRVNTTADEVFTHDIGRDMAEVVNMLNDYITLDETYSKIDELIKSEEYDGEELDKLQAQLEALDKARALAKDKVQSTCTSLIGTCDGYIKNTTLAYTDIGARSSRLSLIQNRLGAQQTNFEELVSNNEDADVTDLAIQLSSVQLTYEAALSSISYVMQTSLLDYI
ncbi:MAG: flagellar hook-associated protein FlgL [Eubacterium sp.]|nr:flagellar hook-associated protein FlgL [Eubacterium sp.]